MLRCAAMHLQNANKLRNHPSRNEGMLHFTKLDRVWNEGLGKPLQLSKFSTVMVMFICSLLILSHWGLDGMGRVNFCFSLFVLDSSYLHEWLFPCNSTPGLTSEFSTQKKLAENYYSKLHNCSIGKLTLNLNPTKNLTCKTVSKKNNANETYNFSNLLLLGSSITTRRFYKLDS